MSYHNRPSRYTDSANPAMQAIQGHHDKNMASRPEEQEASLAVPTQNSENHNNRRLSEKLSDLGNYDAISQGVHGLPQSEQASPAPSSPHKLASPKGGDPKFTPTNEEDTLSTAEETLQKRSKSFLRDTFPIIAYGASIFMHVIAGLSHAIGIGSDSSKKVLDTVAIWGSKIVNGINFVAKAGIAFKHNFGFDALGRIMYPLSIFTSAPEDFYLLSGLSSGLTMYHGGQKRLTAPKPKSNGQNIIEHLKAFRQVSKEILQGGIGKNRKIFTDLLLEKDENRTMHFAAHGNFLGGVLGLIAGKGKSPLKKIASIIRNIGSVATDYTKLFHPEPNFKYAAYGYLGTAALDLAQTFTDNPVIGKLCNNFSLALNNFANYFYANTTIKQVDNEYKDEKKALTKEEKKTAGKVLAFDAALSLGQGIAMAA